jgi:flagellar biosynthesis component FlhA/small nuclear ribonucleoprotein (snRNP)-like protein
MDYHSQLRRFLNRRICVELWGRSTVWGTLASIEDDHLRLLDTIVVGESEGQGWFERMQYGEMDSNGGPRSAETIIRIEVVMHVTCADDDLSEPISECSAGNGVMENGESGSDVASLDQGIDDSEEIYEEEHTISLRSYRITVELGFGLLRLAIASQGGDLLDRIHRLRVQFAEDTGMIIPRVRIKDCSNLRQSAYRIRVMGHVVATGELLVDRLLATNLDESHDAIDGIETTEALRGLPAKWIEHDQRDRVLVTGGCVSEPSDVLIQHLACCVRERLSDLLGYQEVTQLVDGLRKDYGSAVDELIPHQVSIMQLHRLLKSLLEEQVSIRNLMSIIESIAYHCNQTPEYDHWLQRLRVDIGRDICAPFLNDDGSLQIVRIDESIEESLPSDDTGHITFIDNRHLSDFVRSLPTNSRATAILVRRSEIRRALFDAISAQKSFITVIAESELPVGVDVICDTPLVGGPRRLPPK